MEGCVVGALVVGEMVGELTVGELVEGARVHVDIPHVHAHSRLKISISKALPRQHLSSLS